MDTVPGKILFGSAAASDGKLSFAPYGYIVYSN